MNSSTVSNTPVADLHCDLLSYLAASPDHTPDDAVSRCSLPQLRAGRVRTQIMAVYAATAPSSVGVAERQMERFEDLRRDLSPATGNPVVAAAIENASCLATADEPFSLAVDRLTRWHRRSQGLVYLSLTHHDENRFGGGNFSSAGLKDDGRRLIVELAARGIALDLAHTSDALAEDCLAFIDREALPIAVIVSHTNFRALHDHPRNITDDIAREIIRRGGLIGLTALRNFIGGDDPANIARHVAHGLSLGGQNALAFGADFYCDRDTVIPEEYRRYFPWDPPFFAFWSDASGYPALLARLARETEWSEAVERAIAHGNVDAWLARRPISAAG